MLPRVLLMHRVDSSHFESHSGGSIELPSKGFLRDSSQKLSFYEHCFFSLGGPPGRGTPAWGSLPGLPPRAPGGPRCQGAPGLGCALGLLGWAGLAFGSAGF